MAGGRSDDNLLNTLMSGPMPRNSDDAIITGLMQGASNFQDDRAIVDLVSRTSAQEDDLALAGIMNTSRRADADDAAILNLVQGPKASMPGFASSADDAAILNLLQGPKTLLPRQSSSADDAAILNLMQGPKASMPRLSSTADDDAAILNLMQGSKTIADDVAIVDNLMQGPKTMIPRMSSSYDEAAIVELMKGAPPTDIEAVDDAVLQSIMGADAGYDDAALLDLMRSPARGAANLEAELRNTREQELLNRIAALRRQQTNQLKDEAILEQVIAEAGGSDDRPKALPPHCSQLMRIRRIHCIKLRTDDLPSGSLHYFASIRDVTSARFLCERARRCDDRFFVNGTDERECTALHYAAYEGCGEMAEVLLQAGADVLLRDKDGRTALHVAASRGHFDVAKLMIGTCIYRVRSSALRRFKTLRYTLETDSGEDINVIEAHAANTALTEYLRSLEDLRYNLLMTEDRYDFTCIHYAIRDAFHGCMAILKLMLGVLYEFVDDTRTDEVMRDRRFQPQPGSSLLDFIIGKDRISKFDVDQARRNHLQKSLAIRGELVNGRDPYGLSPLHYAAAEGNYRGVHILMQHGADVGAKGLLPKNAGTKQKADNIVGVTPFELAKDSITRKALAGYSGRHDNSLETQAESIVKLVEGNCEYINDTHGVMSRTPLHATLFGAIEAGPPDRWDREAPPPAVMALLQVHPECDPLVPDASGWTPLHYACAYGRDKELFHLVQRVKSLHPHGKRSTLIKGKENARRPLSAQRTDSFSWGSKASTGRLELPKKDALAADPQKAKIERNVRSAGVGGGVQSRPASVGKVYCKFEKPTKSNTKNMVTAFLGAHLGRTPAHLAAQAAGDTAESVILGTNAHLNCLTVLRQFGLLNTEDEDDNGMTPLLAACDKGSAVAVQWLLERGADCYKVDRTKRNGLHLAVARGHRRAIRLLSYYDADESRLKKAQDWKGRRPEEMCRTLPQSVTFDDLTNDFATIWEAARDGDIDQLLRALRAGTDIDALSPAGWTACMYAAEAGNAAVLRHLLALRCQCNPPIPPPGDGSGPNVPVAPRISRSNIRPPHGCGPLHLAAQKGHADICSLLVRQGRARVELRSAKNFTPLMHACVGGHLGAVQALVNLNANLELDVDSSQPSRCLFHILAAGRTEGHAACIQWISAHLDCFVVSEMLERGCEAQGLQSPLKIAASNRRTLHALERAIREARIRADDPHTRIAP